MRKIVIIGASSGLGHKIASDFAAAGWRVGIAARRKAPMQELQDEYPETVVYRTIDVTADDAVERFNELVEETGGMNVLLFASGVGFCDPELTESKLMNTLMVNCVGFAKIVAEAYKYFRRNGGDERGQIAVISSVAATKGIGVSAAYSSSKRFQQMFIDSLDQLARQQRVGVDFTDIRPGFIRTPLLNDDKDYPMIMSVDYAARLIERAIVRRKRVAVIDSRWAVVTGLWRLIPGCIWRRMAIEF